MPLFDFAINGDIIKMYHQRLFHERFKHLCHLSHKVRGALEMSKDMANHSYKLSLVLNAVFHSFSGQILIWWYLLFKSILEKIWAATIISNMSFNLGIGKWYLTVTLLIDQLFTHILQEPFFLDFRRVGTTQGLNLSLIKPFCNNSLSCLFNLACSLEFIL